MQDYKSILLIDIPPLIKNELKERYSDWYRHCLFDSFYSLRHSRADIIVLPAHVFINSLQDSRPIIAFGPPELLEASFLHGAADYLRDPWSCQELLIRCQPYLEGSTLQCYESVINCNNGIVLINGKSVNLSPFQSRLLMILMRNLNSFVDYSLLKEILGIKSESAAKSLHVHIHHLRSMLKRELPEVYGKFLYIKNSSSQGYALICTCG